MRKSSACIFLTLALILVSLAGCGTAQTPSGGGQPASQTPAPSSETPASAPQATEESGGFSGNLLWLNHSSQESDNKWQDIMTQQFMEQNPDVALEIQRLSFDNYVTTLQTKIASGDAPDIFQVEGEVMRTFHSNGYLANMANESWVQNFNINDLENVTINGELIAIPTDTNSMCVTYNRDAFAAAGIDAVPVTLDEFYAACEKLKAAGIAPIAAGYKETWCLMADMQADYITSVLGQDSNAILSLLSREKTFADSPLWRDEFTRLFDRFQYVSDDPFGTDWSTAGDLIATGKAAMILNGTWSISNIREKNPDVSLGVFALPFSNNADDTKLLIQAPQSGYSVFSGSENLEAAKAFLGHLTLPESGSLFANMSQKMSLIKGAESSDEPAWKDVYAYLDSGKTFNQGSIDHNFPNEYRTAVETVVSKHLLNPNRSVDALLADLDTEFDRISQNG